jgi:hypothetical protein
VFDVPPADRRNAALTDLPVMGGMDAYGAAT